MTDPHIAFAGFVFFPRQRRLTRNDAAVRLGSRALDILAILLERAGSVVSKEDIISAVWPNVFVDEANLRVHMSALRKALSEVEGGERLVENVPGRGYAFVGRLTTMAETKPELAAAAGTRSLPYQVAQPIGRELFIDRMIDQLRSSRLVTVTGPGGMGKTTVAIAAAHRLADTFVDGIAFVDFGAITDEEMVVAELRAAVEQINRNLSPGGDLSLFLHSRKMLLVLDNCELLISAEK